MKNLKKILSLLLALIIATFTLASCAEDSNDVEYKENGIQFTLPKSMRQNLAMSTYDYYFDNYDSSVVFTAFEIDEAFLLYNDIDRNITLEEYVALCTKDMDTSKIYLEYNEEREAYSYRYNYMFEGAASDTFFYVVIIGASGNMWCVEMSCEYESSADMLPAFELWANSIRTYNE